MLKIQRRGNVEFLDGEFFDQFHNIQPLKEAEDILEKCYWIWISNFYCYEFKLESMFTILNHCIAKKTWRFSQNYHLISNKNSIDQNIQNPDHSQFDFLKSFQALCHPVRHQYMQQIKSNTNFERNGHPHAFKIS